jgi:phage FluMu gp28-like protein
MHIQTAPPIESESGMSRYLCDFQVEGVTCPARYQYTEKANRIGWTWLDALKNVRKRLAMPGRDYLFTTQTWNGALEYARYLDFWIEVYNLGKFVISRTEEEITSWKKDSSGNDIAVQEKVGIYHFDGGSRIILFSSSPWGLQTFEGDVGWDEAAFHDAQEKMWAAIGTRLQWGFDVSVWSAHNGLGSWFNQVLGKMAKAPGSKWHCRKVDIYKAIEDGLVERINMRSGMNQTREEFLQDCHTRALIPAIFAERFECKPADAGSNLVPWGTVEKTRTLQIVRHHLHDHQIKDLFGYATDGAAARLVKMREWMHATFAPLLATPEKFRLGFDVAASGKGDLASFWIDAITSGGTKQRALLTTQTEDWHFLSAALNWFMDTLPDARGCGDKTGIGRQITWTAEADYPGRFRGVPFTRESKAQMGTRIMNQMTAGEFEISGAAEDSDVAMDFFSIQKHADGAAVIFEATANPLNAASHCDMFWSKALAAEAEATIMGPELGAFSSASIKKGGAVKRHGGFAQLKRFIGL